MIDGQWRKSSRSMDSSNCVEVRRVFGDVEVRNSRFPNGFTLFFTAGEWNAFIGGAKEGEMDLDDA